MSRLAGLLMIGAGVAGAVIAYPMLGDAPAGGSGAGTVQPALPPAINRPAVVLAPAKEVPKTTASVDAPVTRPVLQPQPRVVAMAEPATGLLPRPVEAPQPIAPRGARPDDGRLSQNRDLARDIQRELRRVGCYRGEIDGVWSSETQQSMRTFIDRVNATLPIDEPDHILKTLVQGHPGSACGQTCPAGQSLATDGRCLPSAVVAQVPRKAPPRELPATAAIVAPPMSAPVPPAAVATAPTRGWEAAVAAAPSAPLPGRMSAGAAVAADPAPQPVAPPTIVLRPKQRTPDTPAATAAVPAAGELKDGAPRDPLPRPVVGAIRATEQPAANDPATGLPSQRRQQASAGLPPPRYVGAAPRPQPSYTASAPRPRFGPSIFREMERNAR